MTVILEEIERKLGRDLREAVNRLRPREVRYLVDLYIVSQKQRVRTGNQLAAAEKLGEPMSVLQVFHEQYGTVEDNLEKVLARWVKRLAKDNPFVEWLLSVRGIGPVLASGIIAHVDIGRCNTVGKLWRYAGYDPTCEWKPGQVRPWNASLKRICYLIGTSFVRLGSQPYESIYRHEKERRTLLNEKGAYAERAGELLRRFPRHKQMAIFKQGKLTPSIIDAQARRKAVKIFLSHLHTVWWWCEYGELPPVPWVFVHAKHTDYIPPPNLDVNAATRALLDAMKKSPEYGRYVR